MYEGTLRPNVTARVIGGKILLLPQQFHFQNERNNQILISVLQSPKYCKQFKYSTKGLINHNICHTMEC